MPGHFYCKSFCLEEGIGGSDLTNVVLSYFGIKIVSSEWQLSSFFFKCKIKYRAGGMVYSNK